MYVVHIFVAKSYKLSDKYVKDKSSQCRLPYFGFKPAPTIWKLENSITTGTNLLQNRLAYLSRNKDKCFCQLSPWS